MAVHSIHIHLDAAAPAWFADAMKVFVALWVLVTALVAAGAPANAGEYSLANRPEVTFKDGPAHVSPYPQSRRAASVWQSDACWRDCKSACTDRKSVV